MATSAHFISRCDTQEKGFTLIEIAIGLIILGVLMVPISQLYGVKKVDKEIAASRNNLSTVQSALNKFVVKTGRYPLPAIRNIAAGGVDFGREYTGALAAIPNCTLANNTICRTTGFKDMVAPAGMDPVLVGDLPFATLGLTKKSAFDSNKNRFTYTVTESMTAAASFNASNGVIKVLDNTGADHSGTANNVHYVVVSHGKNQRGAFGLNGTAPISCAGVGRDIANCDNNAQFNSNFLTTPPPNLAYVRETSLAAGAGYFDDFIVFSNSVGDDIWSKLSTGTPSVFTRGNAQVRIGPGTGVPIAKVDIMGTPAKPGNVKATQLETNRLCGFTGCVAAGSIAGLALPAYPPKVFTPSIIAGPINTANGGKLGGGIFCGNKALTGIASADETCNYNSLPAGITVTACTTPGTYPAGIDGSGNLICVIP